MAQEKFICGCKVMYEKEAQDGIIYLENKIDRECAKVFFGYAKEHRMAPFEDQSGRKYELAYDVKGLYVLTRC